jgi:hypothetical protein
VVVRLLGVEAVPMSEQPKRTSHFARLYTVMKISRGRYQCDGLFREGWVPQFCVVAKGEREAQRRAAMVHWTEWDL